MCLPQTDVCVCVRACVRVCVRASCRISESIWPGLGVHWRMEIPEIVLRFFIVSSLHKPTVATMECTVIQLFFLLTQVRP